MFCWIPGQDRWQWWRQILGSDNDNDPESEDESVEDELDDAVDEQLDISQEMRDAILETRPKYVDGLFTILRRMQRDNKNLRNIVMTTSTMVIKLKNDMKDLEKEFWQHEQSLLSGFRHMKSHVKSDLNNNLSTLDVALTTHRNGIIGALTNQMRTQTSQILKQINGQINSDMTESSTSQFYTTDSVIDIIPVNDIAMQDGDADPVWVLDPEKTNDIDTDTDNDNDVMTAAAIRFHDTAACLNHDQTGTDNCPCLEGESATPDTGSEAIEDIEDTEDTKVDEGIEATEPLTPQSQLMSLYDVINAHRKTCDETF